MIRKAEAKDMESIVALGDEFGLATQKIHRITVDMNKIRATVYAALINRDIILLVQEIEGVVVGLVFGMVTSPYFSTELVLQELALYSRKPSGLLRLIDAFEDEAKVRGITKIVFGCKPDFYDMTEIYKHKGYQTFENQYIKTEVK